MKLVRYFTVITISSLLLILPLFAPPAEVQLFPFQPSNVQINVKSTKIRISTSISSEITVNISYYDAQQGRIMKIANYSIYDKIIINLPQRGDYVFRFFSILLADVRINQIGIPLTTPGIILALTIITMILWYIDRSRGEIYA